MIYAKQMRLVQKLAESTRAGVINWQPSVHPDTFQVSFRDNTVRVTEKQNDKGEQLFEIELLNGSGEVVESFDDEVLDRDDTTGSLASWYSIIHELYNTARRTALGAEKVLDEIISDLDDIMPF